MRLSVLMRRPLGEVLAWPESHVRLQLEYLATEPPADERALVAIAQLTALVNNRSRNKDEPGKTTEDFMLWRDVWKPQAAPVQSGVTPEELQLMAYLG